MKKNSAVNKILSDGTNKLSSKRSAAFVLLIMFIVVVIAHMFFGLPIDDYVFQGLKDTLIFSLGFVGAEKFSDALSKQKNDAPKPETEEDFI